jgi:hypothetical protein
VEGYTLIEIEIRKGLHKLLVALFGAVVAGIVEPVDLGIQVAAC